MRLTFGSRIGIAAALLVLIVSQVSGVITPLENAYFDAQSKWLQHTPTTDVVIVEIDAKSLRAISTWPWSRHIHARLIELLNAAQPRAVFYDVDFSTPASDPSADTAIATALGQRSYPFVLPTFWQPAAAGTPDGYVLTRPLSALAAHTRSGLVNVAPRSDGLVRSVVHADVSHVTPLFSAVSLLTSDRRFIPGAEYPIDFRTAPEAFARISFADVLNGRVPPAALRDRVVFVGATALELGDILPVPIYRALPGVVVQALAYQTLQSPPVHHLPAWISVAAGSVLLMLLPLLAGIRWRRTLALSITAFVTALTVPFILYATASTVLPVMPLVVATVLFAVIVLAFSADYQALRALLSAVRLNRREALISSVLGGSIDGILVCGPDGIIQDANAACANMLGYTPAGLQGAPVNEVLPGLPPWHNTGPSSGATANNSAQRIELSVATPSGSLPLEISISAVESGSGALHTLIIRDITERKQQQALLQHQATHDALTGLPNRVLLSRTLEQLDRTGTAALFMLDLDRFKDVNDTLGHATGDSVLGTLGHRLRAALPEQNLIARIGGDEFAVVVPRYQQRHELVALAQRLLARIREPITIGAQAIEVDASIGIALCPEHGDQGGLLLQRADVAMYQAKRQRSAVEFYDPDSDQSSIRRLEMARALRSAIGNGSLRVFYQPKVDLRTLQCTGVEALVRWTDPVLGVVSPAEFVALAEANDLIVPLTRLVLDRALADQAQWASTGLVLDLAVNLSARHLRDRSFVLEILELIERQRIDARRLEFEITETAVMSDPETARETLQMLAQVGVRTALDDFGTGFSSLAYLKHLDLDTLKIDRSFVNEICTDPDDRAIVDSTLRMAKRLSLSVVAEGIETQAQFDLLRDLGCESAQGYWIAKPMPSDQLPNWCRTWSEGKTWPQSQVAAG